MKRRIAIISSSVRDGRLSHRVALFLEKYVAKTYGASTDLIDLRTYDFPLFHERYFNLKDPSPAVIEYVSRIKAAEGIIVVSPVYNGSFPASLKNAVDLLYGEWKKKPMAVVSVTYGQVPGIATVQQLQALFLKLECRVAGGLYTVINAGTEFAEDGEPLDRERAERYAAGPVAELMWLAEKSNEEVYENE